MDGFKTRPQLQRMTKDNLIKYISELQCDLRVYKGWWKSEKMTHYINNIKNRKQNVNIIDSKETQQ